MEYNKAIQTTNSLALRVSKEFEEFEPIQGLID